ncbi:MAG TPA: Gfo/Idh/MocA family oxidoreductase [Candidatus Methylomirabilis sp.]|nr:Gfo/Idh/MocA family oxidoreductase [Candidatus Methylomirabilis sp.]
MNAALGDRKLRIAFAGAGAISPFHLTGWSQTPSVEVVAVCDPIPEKAQARATAFGIPKVYTDFTQMLERERPDAVDIVTPVGTHASLTRIAADHGVHVLCQKPLTPSVAEAETLIRDVGERVRFMVHENFRFRPHYLEARRWIAEGKLGEIRQARLSVRSGGMLSVGSAVPALLQRQPYLQAFPRLIIFELLIHHLDVLRALLGSLMVRSAQIARVNPVLTGEDVAVIVLSGKDGMICVLDGNMSAAGYPMLSVDRLEVMGLRGTLLFDTDRLCMVGSSQPGITYDLQKSYQACFTRAIHEFVRGLRTGEPFPTDRLDNLETLKLMEACYIAAGAKG